MMMEFADLAAVGLALGFLVCLWRNAKWYDPSTPVAAQAAPPVAPLPRTPQAETLTEAVPADIAAALPLPAALAGLINEYCAPAFRGQLVYDLMTRGSISCVSPLWDGTVILTTDTHLLLWKPDDYTVTPLLSLEGMWSIPTVIALPWTSARAIIISTDARIWVYWSKPNVECRYLCECRYLHEFPWAGWRIVSIQPFRVLCATGNGVFLELNVITGECRDVGSLDVSIIPWRSRTQVVKHMALMPDGAVRCLCRGGVVVSLAAGTYEQTIIGNAPDFRRLLPCAREDLVGIPKKTWAIPHSSGVVCMKKCGKPIIISANLVTDLLDVGRLAVLTDGAIATCDGLISVYKLYAPNPYTAVNVHAPGPHPLYSSEWVVALSDCRLGIITDRGQLSVWE